MGSPGDTGEGRPATEEEGARGSALETVLKLLVLPLSIGLALVAFVATAIVILRKVGSKVLTLGRR
jgi:hypothetical protein